MDIYRAVASDVTILRNPLPCGKTVSVARVLQVNMVRSCCAYNCTARDNKTTREVGVNFYRILQKRLNERFRSMKLIERVLTQAHLQSSVASILLVVSNVFQFMISDLPLDNDLTSSISYNIVVHS